MKTYSVKEVAEILNTNPETVRRWIRSGKLESVQTSRKEGNIITEGMLRAFLKATPKYAKFAKAIMMISGTAGISTALATVAASSLLAEILVTNDQVAKAKISNSAIEKKIRDMIKAKKEAIIRKEETVRQIQEEIVQDRADLMEAEKLLAALKEKN